jgi:cobalt-zinc-cadmium efflux system protein
MVIGSDRWNRGNLNASLCRCGLFHYGSDKTERKTGALWMALALLLGLFAIEWWISVWSHSLALLADSGHILVDAAVLGLTLTATFLANRPASGRATFGYGRIEILVALINGLSLVAVAIVVTAGVVERLRSPEVILGLPMLFGACLGLVVNGINVALLYRNSRHDLNLKSAFLHVVADAASSVGLVCASLVIHLWHWMWVDAAISLVIAVLTGLAALPLIKESLEIFLELAPAGIDPDQVRQAIQEFDAVEQVETLRIWTVTSGKVVLSAHIRVRSLSATQRDLLLRQIQAHLNQHFGIQEATLQILAHSPLDKVVLHPLLHRSLTDRVLTGM